jgi:Domain of unknown function (DUF4396)
MGSHADHTSHAADPAHGGSLNRLAASATLHCLTGCAIGEVLGMVIGTAAGWSDAATIALAVFLAFVFGYSLTMVPLVRSGLTLAVALPLAFASDSFSIAVMELVDNGVMLAVPGAMDAPLSNPLFWGALAFALAVAYVFAFPVNRYLIARGQGHAVIHQYHGHGSGGKAADEQSRHEAHDAHGLPPTSSELGSPRKLIAVGVSAMAVTIGVATAGAMLVESRHTDDEAPMQNHSDGGGHDDGGSAASADLSGLAVAADGYRLEVPSTRLAAGERTPFSFSIAGANGRVRQFDEEDGVRMHLIVVRRDLGGYQHLHPTLQANGAWRTELTLAQAGVYRAYADFERNGKKTVLATDLFVEGEFVPATLAPPADSADVGGYRVELDAHAEAETETTLIYRITRAGESVDVEPYLGAGGHLVALREGDLAYLHVHPLDERSGEISFAARFPTPGNYRLFMQFKDEGRVQTAALTVNVGKGH